MTATVIVNMSPIGGIALNLTEAGLVEGRDFIVNDAVAGLPEDAIVANERQLLITATIDGYEEEIIPFVKRMREKNPKLEVWFYSMMSPKDSSLYNRILNKHTERLYEEIPKFLGR